MTVSIAAAQNVSLRVVKRAVREAAGVSVSCPDDSIPKTYLELHTIAIAGNFVEKPVFPGTALPKGTLFQRMCQRNVASRKRRDNCPVCSAGMGEKAARPA